MLHGGARLERALEHTALGVLPQAGGDALGQADAGAPDGAQRGGPQRRRGQLGGLLGDAGPGVGPPGEPEAGVVAEAGVLGEAWRCLEELGHVGQRWCGHGRRSIRA